MWFAVEKSQTVVTTIRNEDHREHINSSKEVRKIEILNVPFYVVASIIFMKS